MGRPWVFFRKSTKITQMTGVTSLVSRASAYVAAMPSAISGNHGHDATFAVALALVHGFALSIAQARPIMLEFNVRCDPPWSEKELDHKLNSAAKVTRHSRPRGYLLGERGPALSSDDDAEPSVTVLDVDTSEPLPGDAKQLSPEQLAEAERIAKELVKLRDAGAIKDANDPEARFYAKLIRDFEAEFTGKRNL